jgi:metal-responsive CopG/Arc/MetJ family transcriptional regulator
MSQGVRKGTKRGPYKKNTGVTNVNVRVPDQIYGLFTGLSKTNNQTRDEAFAEAITMYNRHYAKLLGEKEI